MQAGKEGGSILHLFGFVFPTVSSSGAVLRGYVPINPKNQGFTTGVSCKAPRNGWDPAAPCYQEGLEDDPEYQQLCFKHSRNQPLEGDAERREKTLMEILCSAC